MSYPVSSGPDPLKPAEQKIRDRCNKGCSGPHPASGLIEMPSGPSVKELPLVPYCPLIGNRQLIHQKQFIIGNHLGQIKMYGRGMGKHSHHFHEH